jgi:hypothetical protein
MILPWKRMQCTRLTASVSWWCLCGVKMVCAKRLKKYRPAWTWISLSRPAYSQFATLRWRELRCVFSIKRLRSDIRPHASSNQGLDRLPAPLIVAQSPSETTCAALHHHQPPSQVCLYDSTHHQAIDQVNFSTRDTSSTLQKPHLQHHHHSPP